MIANRIQFDAVKHDIFHPNQLGSICQRSTEDAGLILTHLVRAGWVKGLQTSALAFDITQFFPSINHEMFMAVLRKQGFSPVLVEFFASYLVGRSTVYCWNTFQSDSRSADVAVLDGSPLAIYKHVHYTAWVLSELLKDVRPPNHEPYGSNA
ncbi:unnamed protein product [Cyclocybe aegerita]|uniref:Reverse transcriptase domain-containing protein n=1 Tax=Cyclocybe aegerita TaxID=1973307 RepID=A0A8S0WQX1_CYCAE|nr:unnamed protein product [Cyclocybe aegerita]